MKINNIYRIFTPWFIFALFLLLTNDLLLKEKFPCLITGKLSDFAGLFIFPLFISNFIPKYKNNIYFTTALFFILWKSEYSEPFFILWNTYLPYYIHRTIDYTDLFALIILPFSYYYKSQYYVNSIILKRILFIIVITSFIATAGGNKNITRTQVKYSKKEIYNAYRIMVAQFPEYIVPEDMKKWTNLHYNTKDEYTMKYGMASDSVNLLFYIPKDDIIIRIKFSGCNENWQGKPSEIALFCSYSKYGMNNDISSEGKRFVKKLFKKEILPKLETILKEEKRKKR